MDKPPTFPNSSSSGPQQSVFLSPSHSSEGGTSSGTASGKHSREGSITNSNQQRSRRPSMEANSKQSNNPNSGSSPSTAIHSLVHSTSRQFSNIELQMPPPQQIEETLKTFQWIEAIRSSDMTALTNIIQQYHGEHLPFGTPLHLAAAFASIPIFEHILKHLLELKNFNINTVDRKGNSPLHLAAKAGRASVCDLLLKNGADCTLTNNDGQDASELAKTQAVLDQIISYRKEFVSKKAREMMNYATGGNMSAAQNLFNDSRFAKLVNINYQDPMTGDSLLHISCEQNNVDMAAWCLKMRSDPLLRDKRGKLPMEKTKNDRIKQLLKGVLNQGSFASQQQTQSTGGVKLQGVLYKWTNYASGYKKRWFVLDDGILSYYRSQEDAPVSCRGSMSLQYAKLWIDGTDKNRFDIIGKGGIRYHLRAEHSLEAKRWVIALTESKQWLQDHEGFRNRMNKNMQNQNAPNTSIISDSEADEKDETSSETSADAELRVQKTHSMNTLHLDEDEDMSLSGYEENFHATVNAALAGVHSQQQLVLSCLSLLQNNPNYSQLSESLRKSSLSLLSTINELLRIHSLRERHWQKRLEREESLKRVWEENLRSLATEHDMLQQKAAEEVKLLQDRARSASLAEISDGDEEFFDVQSETNLNSSTVCISNTIIKSALYGYGNELRISLPLSSLDRVEVSLWSVLKNNIGKDLSKIALPVFFNEPLSMLQRLCEDMEYSTLLDMANSKENSLERLQFVAAFAMSNYSSTMGRSGKPFNPLLGETYEYVRRDRGFRYISEQVSHHPPISACHCESDNYVFWAEAHLKNKFWGKSLEIMPQGGCHVILKSSKEHYSWKKVTTCVNNLIVGKLWIDHYGDMIVKNHNTNEVCTLTFKPAGWRGKSQYEIEGNVKNDKGEVIYEISGSWNDRLVSKFKNGADNSNQNTILWKANPIPADAQKMFNFTSFAVTLNELPKPLEPWICKTDSRFRPDQRAMEMGDYEKADAEKVRLEDKQRKVRHDRHAEGKDWDPRWFQRKLESDTGEEHWEFKGGYWERRENSWKPIEGSKVEIENIF